MSVTVTHVAPPPQPPPDIDDVHVTNYSPGGPWELFLRAFTRGIEPFVQIRDNLDNNHFAIYLRPNEARDLADVLFELATQAEENFARNNTA